VHGTIVQQPYEFGYQSMKLMARHLEGDRSFLNPEKLLYVPTETIRADNVEAFWAKLNKLRGK
jgi:ribose transport system substrate-binding protein